LTTRNCASGYGLLLVSGVLTFENRENMFVGVGCGYVSCPCFLFF